MDNLVKLNPGSPLTNQTISGPLTLTGGDSETYGLAVANTTMLGPVNISAEASIKRLYLQQEGLIYASNMNINFQSFAGKRVSLAGNVVFSGSGYLFGAYVIVRIVCDGTNRTLGFPSGWKFVGSAVPASINANKTALLHLWSFGTTEADVVAQYIVEP
jgi:hypothetical protein